MGASTERACDRYQAIIPMPWVMTSAKKRTDTARPSRGRSLPCRLWSRRIALPTLPASLREIALRPLSRLCAGCLFMSITPPYPAKDLIRRTFTFRPRPLALSPLSKGCRKAKGNSFTAFGLCKVLRAGPYARSPPRSIQARTCPSRGCRDDLLVETGTCVSPRSDARRGLGLRHQPKVSRIARPFALRASANGLFRGGVVNIDLREWRNERAIRARDRPAPSSFHNVRYGRSGDSGRTERRRAQAHPGPPHGHQPQGLDDDPPGDLGPAVLAFAERDGNLAERVAGLRGPQDELDLEPVALGTDGIGGQMGQEVPPKHPEAAGGVVQGESQPPPGVGIPGP